MIRFQFNTLIILLFSLATHLYTKTITAPMLHIGLEEGLSKSAVTALLQDESGFIWIGTYDGLNRYDGYQFKIYRPDASNPASLSDNYIQCLLQDTRQNIWVGTKKGLDQYDPVTETFQRITLSETRSVEVTSLCEDITGKLWIGTTQGLCLLDTTLKVQWFSDFIGIEPKIASGWIFSIMQDSKYAIRVGTENEFFSINQENLQITSVPFEDEKTGIRVRCGLETPDHTLFAGSDKGLWQFNSATGVCSRPLVKGLQHAELQNSSIYSLFLDDTGKLWIGTWGKGVFVYDFETQTLTCLQDSRHQQGMQFINQIIQDHNGSVWFGSKTGIYLYDPFSKPFLAYSREGINYKQVDWDVTKSMVQDPFNSEMIWANTDRGLCRIQLPEGKTTWMTDIPELEGHFIHSLFMETKGLLWIGTNGELISFDTQNNIWKRHPEIRHPDEKITLLSFFAIQRDHEGILWLGTFEHGLVRYDPARANARFYFHDPMDPSSLPDNHIWTIFEDNQKRLWIGTDQGFALMDKSNDTFTTWRNEPLQPSSLVSNRVRVITQDHENHLWIGTDGGLCRFDPVSNTLQCYSEKDGMPNHVVHGIIQESRSDNHSRSLWISTNRGLIKMNPEIGEWNHYQMQDGLHHNEFSRQSFCKMRDGWLVFGGINGFTLFNPGLFKINPHPPRVTFTDFQLFYQSIIPGKPFLGKIILPRSISHVNHIVLSRKHEIFSVEFTAFPFLYQEKTRYMYQLEGFSRDWFNAKGLRTATFTNLAPGKYTLHVKAVSADDIWSKKDAILHITMTPSFWQRKPVKFALAFLLAAGLIVTYKFRTHRFRKHNRQLAKFNTQLQKQIDDRIKAEASLLQSQNQLSCSLKEKEILLRELYHRTKNNMQVISSLLRIHSKTVKNKQMKILLQEIQNKIMSMALVHQKLYESSDLSHLNLTEYVKSLVSFIKTQSTISTANVTFSVEGDNIDVLIDTAIPCGLIINELIMNSLKHAFTGKDNGKITIKLKQTDNKDLLLFVKDNGTGLPENFNFEKDINLGLESVIDLVKHQLQGTIHFKNKNGLSCQIHLKEELYKPRV